MNRHEASAAGPPTGGPGQGSAVSDSLAPATEPATETANEPATEPATEPANDPADEHGSSTSGGPPVPREPASIAADAKLPTGRVALAVLLVAAGVLHFVVPRFYEQIVPRWAGNARFHVVWSGVAEVLAGVLLLVPPTRRLGAWLALATLVLVYPANVQMAVDAGRPRDLAGLAVWLRLPLQIPMWRAAWRQTK